MDYLSDAVQIAGLSDEIILTALVNHPCLEKLREDISRLRTRSAHLKGLVIVDENSPNSNDIARISGYPVYKHLHDIWPKAVRSQTIFTGICDKILNRERAGNVQAKASA